jgi:phenylpyruvate tautomerase PptA (4-oxalocrotonate tautomerase family)
MPLLDAYIPNDALSPDAEQTLLATLTDLLLKHEGVDPSNPTGRHLAWLFVHRPEVYVAGHHPRSPRYRFICQVPEGQYDTERRAEMTAAITQAVITAEDGAFPHPERRIVIFTCEVPEGWWSGGTGALGLADIYELIWPLRPDMVGAPRDAAAAVLAERRTRAAHHILAAAGSPPQTEISTTTAETSSDR